MKIEIKTKSLKEIFNKCKTLNWNIDDVKIDTEIWEDVRRPGKSIVKLFIRMPGRKLNIKKSEEKK